MVARYAARFSVRALEVTVDASVLWVGAGLAMAAAVLLAYVPRLPSPHAPAGLGLASGGVRITPGTNRRLRVFATTQIAFSFVLLAGAGMLLADARRPADGEHRLRHAAGAGVRHADVGDRRRRREGRSTSIRKRRGGSAQLPGVEGVAVGSFVPWRDAGSFGPGFQFTVEGYTPADGEENPRARFRIVAPRFFAVLGVPLLAGRDFTDDDRAGSEPVSIVSQSVAQRLFPNGDAVNRHVSWTDPLLRQAARRAASSASSRTWTTRTSCAGPALTVYQPVRQMGIAGRLFVHAPGDPYALVPAVTRVIREISADQPVERAATLEDVRARGAVARAAERLRVSGFAGIALLIAVVGVAGVLAFSVSARTREFGVRLAIGSAPRQLLARVLSEGVADCRDRHRGRRGGRLRAGASGGALLRARAAAGRGAGHRRGGGAHRRGGRGVADAGRARRRAWTWCRRFGPSKRRPRRLRSIQPFCPSGRCRRKDYKRCGTKIACVHYTPLDANH